MQPVKRYEPSFTNNGCDLIEEQDGRAVMLSVFQEAVIKRDELLAKRAAILMRPGASDNFKKLSYKAEQRVLGRLFEPTLDSAGRFFREDPKGRVVMFLDVEVIESQCTDLLSDINCLQATILGDEH